MKTYYLLILFFKDIYNDKKFPESMQWIVLKNTFSDNDLIHISYRDDKFFKIETNLMIIEYINNKFNQIFNCNNICRFWKSDFLNILHTLCTFLIDTIKKIDQVSNI